MFLFWQILHCVVVVAQFHTLYNTVYIHTLCMYVQTLVLQNGGDVSGSYTA